MGTWAGLGCKCMSHKRSRSSTTNTTPPQKPSILRLGILLLLFDVYLTWARIEKLSPSPTTSFTSLTLPPAPLIGGPINATDALASLTSPPTPPSASAGFLASQSILNQYLFFLLLCTLETVVFHGIVRFSATRGWFVDTGRAKMQQERDLNYNYNYNSRGRDGMNTPWAGSRAPSRNVSRRPSVEDMGLRRTSTGTGRVVRAGFAAGSVPSSPVMQSSVPTMATGTASATLPTPAIPPIPTISTPLTPQSPSPTTLSTALLVSSLPNLFPLLMVIWAYDLPSSASAVSWAVIVNNIAALEILLDCGVLRATGVVGVAGIGRWLVGRAVLGAVGLGGLGGDFGIEQAWSGLRGLVSA
jgi:hypothetical protein